jgi:L-alanine-DL-glutamate epimerase-like enolase superfamily enzyme
MKIRKVSVYRALLPYVGGTYVWGRGHVIDTALTTVVVIETDAGITGCGESCPIGGNYLAAYPEGIAAAAPRLARAIIGMDPRELGAVERRMDQALKGHSYAKSAFDNACWDILGKACGLPVYMLLGGKLTHGAPMYRVAPQKSLEETRREIERHRQAGYRQFQVKVGADPDADIERIRNVVPLLNPGERAFADANTGWSVYEVVRVVRAVRDLDIMIEQPCVTYEECLQVRSRCDHPMKLDECITGLDMVARVVADRSAEVLCLKISNAGGLSKARRMRDIAVEHGISVVAEDTWGGEITTAALAHFAASTPPEYLYNTTDLHNYNTVSTGMPAPPVEDGMLFVSDAPGLGVEPDFESLGAPVEVIA